METQVEVGVGPEELQGGGPRRHRRGLVLLGVVAVVVVAELTVRVFAGPLPEPQLWSTPEIQYKVGLMQDHPPVEVALTGSSVVDVAVDPDGLDRPAFNAALGAGSIGMVADFTLAVTVPVLDPEIVVIGITSRELNGNATGQAELEARFVDAPAVREALGTESLLDRILRSASDVSALVRYRAALRDPDVWLGNTTPEWGEELTNESGLYLGFRDAAYRREDSSGTRIGSDAAQDFEVGEAEVERLRDLIGGLVEDGRRVLLLATPVTSDYVELHPRGAADQADFLRAASDVADDLDVPFVDAGVWDSRLFADPLHVNGAGLERLTTFVRGALDDQNWK